MLDRFKIPLLAIFLFGCAEKISYVRTKPEGFMSQLENTVVLPLYSENDLFTLVNSGNEPLKISAQEQSQIGIKFKDTAPHIHAQLLDALKTRGFNVTEAAKIEAKDIEYRRKKVDGSTFQSIKPEALKRYFEKTPEAKSLIFHSIRVDRFRRYVPVTHKAYAFMRVAIFAYQITIYNRSGEVIFGGPGWEWIPEEHESKSFMDRGRAYQDYGKNIHDGLISLVDLERGVKTPGLFSNKAYLEPIPFAELSWSSLEPENLKKILTASDGPHREFLK